MIRRPMVRQPRPKAAEISGPLELVRHPPSQSMCCPSDGRQDILVRNIDNQPASLHEISLQDTSLVGPAIGTIQIIQPNIERGNAVVEPGKCEVNLLKDCLLGSGRHLGLALLNMYLHGLSPDGLGHHMCFASNMVFRSRK